MKLRTVRWGYMVYAGDNYHWCPDEFIFSRHYPSSREIHDIFGDVIKIERKKYKVYLYSPTGEPMGYLYELEE